MGDLEPLLRHVQTKKMETPLTVVLVSSVGVWGRTPTKEGGLCDSDWPSREPLPDYRLWKDVEDLVISILIPKVKVVVLTCGMLYGHGESQQGLYHVLKCAWLGQEGVGLEPSPSAPLGCNQVPSVHLSDAAKALALVVKGIVEPVDGEEVAPAAPGPRFLIIVDQAADKSQRAMVQAAVETV